MKTLAKIYPGRVTYWVGDGHLSYVARIKGEVEKITAIGHQFVIDVRHEGQYSSSLWADEIQKGESK